MTLLRIEYTKTGLLRYLGHLDMVRLFERGLRRGQVPLQFSQGFNPHPKIAFAAPLSVGYSSEAELVEIEVEEGWDDTQLQALFSACFPEEICYRRHRVIQHSKSLMSLMRASDYTLIWSVPQEGCQAAVEAIQSLMTLPSLTAVKKSKGKKDKEIDLRPMVHALSLVETLPAAERILVTPDSTQSRLLCDLKLHARLDAGSESNLKPDLLMAAVAGLAGLEEKLPLLVHRTALYGPEGQGLFELE